MTYPAPPVLPSFETGEGEGFTLGDLRANFWIVNSRTLRIKFPPSAEPAPESVSLRFEDEVLSTLAPSPDPAGPNSALDLLRGRNLVEIRFRGVPAASVIPVFYKTTLRDWAESIIKALVVLLVIQFYVVQPFYIPTGSMENTLHPGNYIMVERFSYLLSRPQRGDVVVFQYPQDPRKDFIKRLVAAGGDSVEVRGGKLTVNGVPVDEPYALVSPTPSLAREFGPYIVAADHLFVMGDNRDRSSDSRTWGSLPMHRLKGKALLVYWPITGLGLVRHERGIFERVRSAALAGPHTVPPDALEGTP